MGGLGRLFLCSLNEFVGFSNGAVHVSDQSIDLGVDLHQLSFQCGQRARNEVVFQVEHLVAERDKKDVRSLCYDRPILAVLFTTCL